jgi:hypothetical protein
MHSSVGLERRRARCGLPVLVEFQAWHVTRRYRLWGAGHRATAEIANYVLYGTSTRRITAFVAVEKATFAFKRDHRMTADMEQEHIARAPRRLG